MDIFYRIAKGFFCMTMLIAACHTSLNAEVEILDIDIFSYEDFAKHDSATIDSIRKALLTKGIVGLRGIPGYKEAAFNFIAHSREFSALDEKIKQAYAPNRKAGEFLGYEIGMEKFLRPDGQWKIDDSKASYYALVPDKEVNVWPSECDLRNPFLQIANIMLKTGRSVLESLELMPKSFPLDRTDGVGRMLHYHKQSDETMDNPFWCGAHFDHGLFTALMPAFYFVDGKSVSEPLEAGLFVRAKDDPNFYKVISDDPDVLLFQVGEFGQLATDDAIRATEHCVRKAKGGIERFTLAVFFSPPMDTTIHSCSQLTSDLRYSGEAGDPCTFEHWNEASLNRYLVSEED